MKVCKLCQEKYKNGRPEHFGSNPACAFPDGVFTSSNWQCATANALRSFAYEAFDKQDWGKFCTRCDDESIGILWIPDTDNENLRGFFYIVMTYYKDRGCTSSLHFALDGEVRPLTLKEAEDAIEILGGKKKN